MCIVAEAKTAMVKPCASATARTSCPAVLIAPIPTKMRAKVPTNSASQGRNFSMVECNQIAFEVTSLRLQLRLGRQVTISAAGVVWVFLAQLPPIAIGLIGFASPLIGQSGFLQRARGDCRIVVEQGDAHESFARLFVAAAFKLHVARQQARL